jgi:hypothetical protein
MPGAAETVILPFMLPHIAGMTGGQNNAQSFVEMGSFCLGWPQAEILWISVSQIARITSLSHCAWPQGLLLVRQVLSHLSPAPSPCINIFD